MNLYCRILLSAIIAGLLCLPATELHAQRQPVITATPLVGDSVKNGKTLTVQDTVYANISLRPNIAFTHSLNNVVSLYINEYTAKVFPDTFHVTVRIRADYTTTTTSGSRLDTLEISYSKDHPYNSKAIKFYNGYYSLQVEILDVAITGATDASVRPLLMMENMIVLDRNYTTDCAAVPSISNSDTSLASAGELSVAWEALPFIPSYDLEWTFIDSAALDAGIYTTGGSPDPQLIFKNNSTRVSVSGNSYRIPLLYDGGGKLFLRVRGIQNAQDGTIIPGTWSSDDGLGAGESYSFGGHERNLNWQATTSFAEEGKRKSVVQYFDGSLKGRQTVTKDNTTNTTVVAETLYDKQGRPVIQVLPSPTLSKLIAYTPLFNVKNINSAEYDKSVYDTLYTADDYCATGADSMSVASGASRYYSPANPLSGSDHHQYIPDAKGFAFAETRYTRDNTGRIDRQGGVGDSMRIGTGHETRYFYGAPKQRELDALFGTEAGDASHYEKNMVRDANGQYSVSYVDMHGRTVATALAGGVPSGMDTLSSYSGITQTHELLTATNNVIKGNIIQSAKSILVPKAGVYKFNYSLSPESLSLDDCSNTAVCYDCLYDLTITISDNCNNQQFGGTPKVITLRNFSLFKEDSLTYNLDTTCTVAMAIDTSFDVALQEGSYDITKVLSVSKEGMQYYRDSIYIPHNTCKSYAQLALEQLDSIRQRLECTPDSLTTNLVVAYREQMISDLRPGSGQYGGPALQDCFSIFNPAENGKYFYQSVSGYKDVEGNPDMVNQFNGTEYELVPPEKLTPEEFTAQYKESWGETLLTIHPEYQLLLEYDKLKSAYAWEAGFSNTQTFADAVAKGYLNPAGNTNAPGNQFTVSGKIDSVFDDLNNFPEYPGLGDDFKSNFQIKLSQFIEVNGQYLSLWGLATAIVKCNSNDASCFNHWNDPDNAFNADSLCTADLDMAWRLFRSQYLQWREDAIDVFVRAKTGVYATNIKPCDPVFPDRGVDLDPDQLYGGYDGTQNDSSVAKANFNNFLLANCTAYATKWWQELRPCGYTLEDSAEIVSRLIAVAYAGADKNHPFGSSTISPFSSNTDTSFVQVINEYNAIHYPAIDPLTCNAYLISSPKPFNQPGIIVNHPIIAAPDECTCTRISAMYSQFIIDSSTYHSFSNYMQQAHGATMREGLLDTLRSLCIGTSDCRYLEKPILLPPAFQCNTGNICADCNEVRTLYDSFAVEFPGAVPTKLEPDSAARHINQVFANYMNQHLGFSKQAFEYLEFLETCPEGITPCDSSTWIVFNPGANLEINADLYANAVNNIHPYSQFFTNGYFNGPSVSQAAHYVLVNKRDSIDVTGVTALMQWRVKPDSVLHKVNPFIRRGTSTTYVGAEWIQDPEDGEWWIGATILKPEDGSMIAGMGLSSNSHGLQADWVKITNATTGSVLYFQDFTSTGLCGGTGPFLCGKQASDSSIVLNMNECADSTIESTRAATFFFDLYRQKLKGQFEKQYTTKCLDAGKLESFTVRHDLTEYHYTLYYYDQAGNLVKTIPPEGVHAKRDSVWLDEVSIARNANDTLRPRHRMATTYRYNSLNQVISQHSPDGGLSGFWYDRLGRLVVSQNAKQAAEGNYSYTLYDILGRITEVGQKKQIADFTDSIGRSPQNLASWLSYSYTLDATTVIAEQVTRTVYDIKDPESSVLPSTGYVLNPAYQKAYTLRNRVSFTRFYEKLGWNGAAALYSDYDNSSTYSYDIHGSVDTLLHHYRTGMMASHTYNQFKAMAYKYDLISGKVNEVHYQPGMADQFYHRYEYDAENRLTDVYTADRKQLLAVPGLEEHEARYSYYKHGPLAKAIIGQQQVQGIDYAYTLQGWLKGVNCDSLLDEDGTASSVVAKDAYRFSLNYFNADYTAIGAAVQQAFPGHSAHMQTVSMGDYRPLYNGNISSMVVGIPKIGETRLYNYKYDQLNRLVRMDSWKGYNTATHSWAGMVKTEEYKERISYDGNGNIKSYQRNGNIAQLAMDNLTYGYNKEDDTLINNRLRHVKDAVGNMNWGDIGDQVNDNYEYDPIGNLIKDSAEHISVIEWTVYGKIKKITKTDGTVISYTYDVSGNRISKAVTISGNTTTTWYVRDAQGNPMGIYTGINSSLTLTEQALYGSSRVGVWNRDIDMDEPVDAKNYIFERGNKFFELSNHLGNVLVTVSDKMMAVDGNNDGTVDYYNANVLMATDYYPGGMNMPGRYSNETGYRYGFNGKEKDTEGLVQYDYGFRIYDPRLMRFKSIDPLTSSYPMLTPYQFASNTPIWAIDLDGLESKTATTYFVELINWLGSSDNTPSKVLDRFDRTYDPLRIVADGIYGSVTGKDLNTQLPVDQSKVGAEAAMKLIMLLAGPKVKMTPAAEIEKNVVLNLSTSTERELIVNSGNIVNQVDEVVTTTAQASKKLQVGTYKEMTKANANTGLVSDHIPSFAAIKKYIETQTGVKLTPVESRALRQSTLAIVYEAEIHQTISRTFAGRNLGKIIEDAANLRQAVLKDIETLTPSLLKQGYSQEEINSATQTLINKYETPKP